MGYNGFQAVFGAKYLSPTFGGSFKDLDGNVLMGSTGPGFPGFSPTATQTLGAVATAFEQGVPVVFAYISDLHDNRSANGTFGPGEAAYVAQAQAYNKAFGQFFTRLANDGIDPSNTLFVFTPDEGDHFAGGSPSPANCDGVNVPCTYSTIGELDLNLNTLVQATGNNTVFSTHSDDAPTVYIKGNPDRTDMVTRQLEQTMAGLTANDPYTGNPNQKLMVAMADPIEEQLLHMVTSDPNRTPTFTFFGNDDYFFASFATGTPTPEGAEAIN
jgi:hypothetical protein